VAQCRVEQLGAGKERQGVVTCDLQSRLHFQTTQLHITHLLQEINLSKQNATGVGALLHAMLPQLASLSFGQGCGSMASTTILLELAQAAGGVLPLHILHIDNANLSTIAPIVGSLQKLSLDFCYHFYYPHHAAKGEFESLLAHAQQLQELELQYPPPPRCAWVSPSLQKLSFVSGLGRSAEIGQLFENSSGSSSSRMFQANS